MSFVVAYLSCISDSLQQQQLERQPVILVRQTLRVERSKGTVVPSLFELRDEVGLTDDEADRCRCVEVLAYVLQLW